MAGLEMSKIPGTDLLQVSQVADRERRNHSTVLRWIERGFPSVEASREQLGYLIAMNLLKSIPQHKVYLIRVEDLQCISSIQEFTKPTRRPRKGKTIGEGSSEQL